MQFVRLHKGQLVFVRVREVLPENELSTARSHTMLLDAQWVATSTVDGRPVWRAGSSEGGI